jgi:hypothetical protein
MVLGSSAHVSGQHRARFRDIYHFHFVVGLILIYAIWWTWAGGLFWGPRFFLFASIPASFALAVRLHKPGSSLFANLFTLIALAWSVCVGLDGAVYDLNAKLLTCLTSIAN